MKTWNIIVKHCILFIYLFFFFCRLPLQRVPSIKAAPKHNLNAPQEELLRQSIDPTEQASSSPLVTVVSRALSAPAGFVQEVDDHKNWLLKCNSLPAGNLLRCKKYSCD